MKLCGILEIDKENKALINEAKKIIQEKRNPKIIVNKIQYFRIQLACNKGTELLESTFGWTKIYDDLIEKLTKMY